MTWLLESNYDLITTHKEMRMETYIYKLEDFSLDNQELMLNETLFHNANGYLGVRSNFEEGYPENYQSIRGEYLNGFYDFAAMPQAEKLHGLVEEKQTMLNIADTQSIKLCIDGEEFSLFSGVVLKKNRILDMMNGITIREIIWQSPSKKEVSITIKRMASFSILPLFLIEYKVTPLNFNGVVTLISSHIGEVMNYFDPADPRVSGESFQHLFLADKIIENEASYMSAKTSKSDLTVCSAVKNIVSAQSNRSEEIKDKAIIETFHINGERNIPVTLFKYTILCDSIRYKSPVISAKELLQQVLEQSPEQLYKEQTAYLKNFWSNCNVEIQGDDEVNQAVRYNLYQLLQSVGKDPYSNIAAKGLSGEGYEGHYFWDTEIYMQPFFTLTAPDVSKNLINYRYTILDYARENAKLLGHKKGALYPWRTIMGKECSGYFPSGTAQYHISGDVAYSVVAYYLTTKDLGLIRDCGAEILIETARLWIDTGNYINGEFHINEVTGPDEYTCMVNNNYYTNALAQYNLKWAAKFYELLKDKNQLDDLVEKLQLDSSEIEAFKAAADAMYLPYDEALGINPQDDSFLQKKVWDMAGIKEEEKPLLLHYHPLHLYRYQVCKQADTVLAHFILEDTQDLETIRRSFEYYEKVTTHDSSLSTCIFSIVASKLGLEEKAYHYFGESSKLDLFNTHKNTKDGIHTANMGGTYMSIVYGFGGLRIKENGLSINPSLPKAWSGYSFCAIYERSRFKVDITREECVITLEHGKEINLKVYGKDYILKEKLIIKR
jgi:alpha,alpha-trehalose phosphorylase